MNFDTFHVVAIDAKNVVAIHKSKQQSDPFLSIKTTFNKQHFKTKVCKKTLTPKWNQEMEFFTTVAKGEIIVKMMDHDRFTPDAFMGEFSFNISDFCDGKQHTKSFTLKREPAKKKICSEPGEVSLKLWVTGPGLKEGASSGGSGAKAGPPTISDYAMGPTLGKGAFSVVKKAVRKKDNKTYAIKCINKNQVDAKELAMLEREIDIMKKLRHPNIIQLYEVIDTKDTLFLVLEYVAGGELFDAIVNKGNYSENAAALIVRQVIQAIEYCHKLGIAHRDLKPENLLLKGTDSDFVKVADFGLSKDFSDEALQTSCGTPDYVAPEVLMGEPYDMNVDVWSIGVITYILLCGFPPFYGDSQKELFDSILEAKYDFPSPEWDGVSKEAKDFVSKILVVDPMKRMSAEACLAHPWLGEKSAEPKALRRLESFSVKKLQAYNEKYRAANPKPT